MPTRTAEVRTRASVPPIRLMITTGLRGTLGQGAQTHSTARSRAGQLVTPLACYWLFAVASAPVGRHLPLLLPGFTVVMPAGRLQVRPAGGCRSEDDWAAFVTKYPGACVPWRAALTGSPTCTTGPLLSIRRLSARLAGGERHFRCRRCTAGPGLARGSAGRKPAPGTAGGSAGREGRGAQGSPLVERVFGSVFSAEVIL